MFTEKNQHLKEDIDKKVNELQHTVRIVNKLEKERTLLKMEIQNYSVTLQHTRTELKEKKMEIERLYKQISVRNFIIFRGKHFFLLNKIINRKMTRKSKNYHWKWRVVVRRKISLIINWCKS